MTTAPIVHIADDADRAALEQAIQALRVKAKRLPAHWVDERKVIGREVDRLVAMWVRAGS